ncbi:potassium channel family protein [Treponema putidum]|uniref:TrkA family potassium uptake protein n=1 Tax=Treponema putidum TaxID=221027 RepID=A0ABY5HY79_9SPIR|nr:TrkA family potassium uptake protein [Treponema putidum]UTY29763.1 TrkA family potassium uptake protein [Treponema putidum]
METTKNFAVIGLGEFGSRICEVLVEGGASVVAFDHDIQAVERIKKIVPAAMLVETTNEEALLKAPLDDVEVAIVAIGNNIEASVLTTTLLKQRDIPYVLSRAVSPLHATVLRRVGANEVLNIEISAATRIARRLISPDVMDSIAVTKDFSIREIIVPKFFIGKTVGALALKEKFNINLIALVRMDLDIDSVGNPVKQETMHYPEDELELREGDKLFLIGSNIKLEEFRNM